MGIGSFLQGVGQNIGHVYEWNQKNDLRQAEVESRQQNVEEGKARTAANTSLTEARARISQQITEASVTEQGAIADPKRQADIWGRAEEQFALAGDNEGAIRAGKLSDGYRKEHENAAVAATKAKQEAQEDLSMAAFDFRATPSADNASAVARAAVKAGINPLEIPRPGTTEFATWAETQTQASMTGKERYSALEKEREFAINKRLEADRIARQDADRDEARALRAQIQAGIAESRRDKAEDKRDHTDFLETEKLTSTLQASAKPLLEDRQRITTVKGLLAVNSSEGDRQVRQALTGLLGHFKGRATNLFYQDSKTFGDVVQRMSGWTSQTFTGRYDEKSRVQLAQMLDKMEKETIDPALTALERKQKEKAKRYGLDEEQIQIQGDFSRKAPGGPKLERRTMADGTILEKQADGTIVKVSK